MTDTRSTALAASLVGGYLLGRGGKTQAALGIAAYLAGKKLLDRRAPSDEGSQEDDRHERTSPLRRLGRRARGELLGAGVSALTGAVNRRMDHVADLIETRSQEPGAGSASEAERGDGESGASRSSGEETEHEAREGGTGTAAGDRHNPGSGERGRGADERSGARRGHSTATKPTPPTPDSPTDSSAKG